MLIRSWLSQSTLRNNLLAKSLECGADVADFDLEDSVPQAQKDEARAELVRHMAQKINITTAVRINHLSSVDGIEDLLAIVRNRLPLDIVILPKALVSRDVPMAHEILADSHPEIRLVAMIETVEGWYDLREVRQSSPALTGIMFGVADFAADRGMRLRAADLTFAKHEVAMACSRLGVTAIDSPCFEIRDDNALARELTEVQRIGFSAKVAIHPSQVPVINDFFSPTPEAIREAQEVVAAMTSQPDVSITVRQGTMIGPPFLAQAKNVLDTARQINKRK